MCRVSQPQLHRVCVGGPVPLEADAVVQIEDTEQLSSAPSGRRRVKILKASASSETQC